MEIVPKESPQKINRVIFDFDNTLFDTEKRKKMLYEIAEIHGYDRARAKQIYQEACVVGEKIIISLSSFLHILTQYLDRDKINFLRDRASEIIKQMHQGNGVLPGARELVKYAQEQEIDRYILSLGVRGWQEEKVVQSGLREFFPNDNVIYTDVIGVGKIDVLRQLFGAEFDGSNTIIFDDKPDETARLLSEFPHLRAFVRREERDTRYATAHFIDLAQSFSPRVIWHNDLRELTKKFVELYERT